MKSNILIVLLVLGFFASLGRISDSYAEEQIRIGVQATLTGPAASFGQDIKNGIEFAQRSLGNRYSLQVEDDRCDPATAITVAQRFISIERVHYVLGIACNATLLAVAPLYQRAGVVVLAATASGDVHALGENNFRLLPSDILGAKVVTKMILSGHHRNLGIITETTEYATMIERTLLASLSNEKDLITTARQFASETTDLRSIILQLRGRNIDALFINTDTESTFITVVRQLRELHVTIPLYGMYWPGSPTALAQIPRLLEGIQYADLPSPRSLMDASQTPLMEALRKEYGPSKSFEFATTVGYESMRILDAALSSSRPVSNYLHETEFSGGPLGTYHFNTWGEIEGISFQTMVIRNGVPVRQ